MRSERTQEIARNAPVPKIRGYRCRECGLTALSYRALCQNCSSKKLERAEIQGKGSIFAYTIIRVGPEQFKGQEPYAIAVVKLDSGMLVSGRLITDAIERIENGMRVILERQDDVGFWFRNE